MASSNIQTYAPLDEAVKKLLKNAADRLVLSARSYFKVIKIARIIADLAGDEHVSAAHISEALQYRS
jgi:magnesium chelatase family protein